MLTYLLIVLGVVVVQAIIGFLVYRDAAKLRMENPGVWFLTTMVLGIISLVFYVVARTSHKKQAALFEQLYRAS